MMTSAMDILCESFKFRRIVSNLNLILTKRPTVAEEQGEQQEERCLPHRGGPLRARQDDCRDNRSKSSSTASISCLVRASPCATEAE